MFAWMTTIETKQNELDAKFISMLDIQHTQIQTLVDMKMVFLEFLGTQVDLTKPVLFLKPNPTSY